MYNNKKMIGFMLVFVLIISLALFYLMYGNLIDAWNKMLDNKGNIAKTHDAFTLLYSLLSIIVSSLFSFLVYRISVQSYDISKKMSELEIDRENAALNQDATIILTMITRNLNVIKEMYSESLTKPKAYSVKDLALSESWAENIANLMKGQKELFSEYELNQTYDIFEDFVKLNRFIKDPENEFKREDFAKELTLIIRKYFNKNIPTPLYSRINTETILELLNVESYILLRKLYYLTVKNSLIEEKEVGKSYRVSVLGIPLFESSSPKRLEGNIKLYDSYGYIKLEAMVVNNIIRYEKYNGYSKKGEKLYEFIFDKDNYKNGEQNIKKAKVYNHTPSGNLFLDYFFDCEWTEDNRKNGIQTKYGLKGKLVFHGNKVDGMKNGHCYYRKSNGNVYIGKFENDKIVEGEMFWQESKFTGQFHNGEPWKGSVINYKKYNQDLNDYVYHFSGSINNGKLYEGVGYTKLKATPLYEQYESEIQRMEDNHMDEIERYEDESYVAGLENNHKRNTYPIHAEYIRTEWKQGKKRQLEEIEENIKVKYYE
ncbi:hypothetical protein SAMN04487919_13010 [Bacillus sp. ok061]|uniref:hypothetical protein n=1 Tax=Bacillus sp. ok061 TaxID=1761766 RepID=UPI00089E24B9|nr:hypothetical protein [Bacillus sp. ok061]SEG81056.1 hypothetical protein SAMN04487919_13010 [Bacillus sp. ok061]